MTQQYKNLQSSPYPHQGIDRETAIAHLSILGYQQQGEDIVYPRVIVPDGDPRKGTHAQARNLKGLNWAEVELFNQNGYGIYFVVNGGGHSDKDVTHCRAIFCEFDDRPIEDQINFWQDLGLPEPSLQIATRKSVHTYWVFSKLIPVDQWRELQTALLTYTGSDQSLKNPSRVMRLAGAYHIKPGCDPLRCDIIHQSDKRYSYEELKAAIPVPQPPAALQLQPLPQLEPQSQPVTTMPSYQRYEDILVPVPDSVPLDACLSKESRLMLVSGVSQGERNTGGAKLARDLLGTANYLQAIGQRFHGDPRLMLDEYASRCTPPLPTKEVDSIWKSAEKDSPGPSCTAEGVQTCIRAWYWNNHVKPNQPGREHIRLHPDTISEVKQRADIFDIISEHIALSKRGKDNVGLCPFHDDKTPSFIVSPTKQTYECLGCGAAGNAIKFLMELGKHSFTDVVLDLARRYQVSALRIDGSKAPVPSAPLSYQAQSRGKGGSKGDGGNGLIDVTLEQRIDEILDRNLDSSDEDAVFLRLSKASGTTKRDIVEIASKRILERELVDNRLERLQELEVLENLDKGKINLERLFYRQPAVGKALTQLCLARSLRAEYFLGILPIVSMLSGTETSLKIAHDFIVPTVVNIGLVGESSDRKSVVSNLLMKPLRRIQSELYELHKKQKAEYEKEVARWEQLNPKTRGPSPREDEFITVPDAPFIVTEQTREGLVKAHEKNRNGLLLYKAELASVPKGFNVYRNGRGDDEEFFNNLWDGDEITRVLASQETVRIPKTCIPQFGGIQPPVLLNLMDMNDPNGRWARYLWILCPLEKRLTSFLDPVVDISPMLYSMYSRMMHASKMEHVLSRKALVLFDQQNQLYEDLQFSNPQAGMRALYGKIPGMIARIALNLHRMNAAAAGVDPELEIPIEAVQVASEVVQFCLGQLTIIRAMGDASVEHEFGLPAVYREIQKLAKRLVGKEKVLTARRVLAARLPVFRGKKANDVVKVFKDMAALGKGQLAEVKRSLGLLVSSVIGGGGSNSPDSGDGGGGSPPNSPTITPLNPTAGNAEDLLKNNQELEPSGINTSSRSAELLNMLKDEGTDTTSSSITAQAFSVPEAFGLALTQTGIQDIQQSSATTQQIFSNSPDTNSANNSVEVPAGCDQKQLVETGRRPDDLEAAPLKEEAILESHQIINSSNQLPLEQPFEPVVDGAQPDHQLSTSSPNGELLNDSEMAAWHQRLNACQTLDDATDFCTALDALTPLQRNQFESRVPDSLWAWLFNLPEMKEPEPKEPESGLEVQQPKSEEPVLPTLESLKALLLACDTLAALNELKRNHKKTIDKAYRGLSESEQANVDAIAALAVPYKVFKYLGDEKKQGTERLIKGTLVYLDPRTQVRSTACSARVWALNGVPSGWQQPVEVSFNLLKEVVKVVLPDDETGGQQIGLI